MKNDCNCYGDSFLLGTRLHHDVRHHLLVLDEEDAQVLQRGREGRRARDRTNVAVQHENVGVVSDGQNGQLVMRDSASRVQRDDLLVGAFRLRVVGSGSGRRRVLDFVAIEVADVDEDGTGDDRLGLLGKAGRRGDRYSLVNCGNVF